MVIKFLKKTIKDDDRSLDEKFRELIASFPSETNKAMLAEELKELLGISLSETMDCKAVSKILERELDTNETFVINSLKRHGIFSSFAVGVTRRWGTGSISHEKLSGKTSQARARKRNKNRPIEERRLSVDEVDITEI